MDARAGNRWRGASVLPRTRVTADRVAFCLGAVAFSVSTVALWDAAMELPPMASPGVRIDQGMPPIEALVVAASNPAVDRSSVHAWYRGGRVVLEGSVPDAATHEQVRSTVDAFVPADAVDDRLVLDPDAGEAPASIRLPIDELLVGDRGGLDVGFEPVVTRLGGALRQDADTALAVDARGAGVGDVVVDTIRGRLAVIGVDPDRIVDAADTGVPGPVAITGTVLLTIVVAS